MVRRLALFALLLSSTAWAQDITNHSVPVGGGPGFVGWKSVGPCPAGQVLGWNSPTSDPVCLTGGGGGGAGVSSVNGITGPITFVAGTNMTIVPGSPNAQSITLNSTGGGGGGGDPCLSLNLTGDVHSTNSCLTTLATVNGNVGTFGSPGSVNTITVNAKGLITAVVPTPITLPFTSITGTLGCAQMPAFTGDVTSGAGTCANALANGVVTNAKLANIPAASLKGNPTNASAAATDFTIASLPNKALPDASNDKLLLFDNTAGTLKYCTINQCVPGSGTAGVSSLNALTGALNLSGVNGITITPSGSNLQIGFAATTNPTLTSLVGVGPGTYTVPAGVVRLEVQMMGGGGGGQGGGTSPGPGGTGGNTTFGSFTASAGGRGADGGPGGSYGNCDNSGKGVGGGQGDGGSLGLAGQFNGKGGMGGASFWGGGGGGNYNVAGGSSAAFGAGGGGGAAGAVNTSLGGHGGGAAGYCFINIRSGLAASYSYSIGGGGPGGAAGSGSGDTAGAAGVQGMLLIKEYYSAGGGSGGGGTAGVTSLNTLLGDLNIVSGSGISVTQSGSTITITNSAAAPTGFTTGDIKPTMKTTADSGWVMLNDGTIGDASSGGTARANADTQSLFYLLWSTCATYCIVSPSRGGDAVSDYAAHKTVQLPQSMGRAVGVAGAGSGLNAKGLGQFLGTEVAGLPNYSVSVSGSHTLTYDEMPSHTHATDNLYPWEIMWYCADGCSGTNPYGNLNIEPGSGNASFTGGPGGTKNVGYSGNGAAFTIGSTGTATPQTSFAAFEPRIYWNFMIKL
jgi:hypothetical protein